VTDSIFFLTLNLSDAANPSKGLIHDVAAAAFEKLGCAAEFTESVLRDLDAELTRAAAHGTAACEIRFRVEAGSVAISVQSSGHPEWRLTRPLPPAD
jgi:hypothetical protein